MLDFFLVLGQIPGTNYQISFEQILAAVGIPLVIYLQFKKRPILKNITADVELFYLKARYLYFRSRII